MDELFGLSMNVIAAVCVGITLAIFALLAFVAIRNPVMFKMGVRNIPRRPAQTTLIIVGLMLSTVIMTAAFGTGDTMTNSITAEAYTIAGEVDIAIQYNFEDFPAAEEDQIIPNSVVDQLRETFADDDEIDAFLPMNTEQVPIFNPGTRLNEAAATIVAYTITDAEPFGGLRDTDGHPVELSGPEIAVNEELAEEVEAKQGDTIQMLFGGEPIDLTVKAIVPNTLLGGTLNSFARQGGAVDMEFFNGITGQTEGVDVVFVTNRGGVRDGVELTDSVVPRLEAELEGTPFEVVALKQDALEDAQTQGSFFTSFFVVFGLFSIAAGVLLIFLIFVMLAAERKPEMGMARAVGAKRRQIVESFLAEGMGYDLGSALIGVVVGIGVVYAMVGFITASLGSDLGLIVEVHITLRSLVVAFCLGVIATFIVIFFASWRASRINITAAIRDLPETRGINPEGATWMGYLRGVLNAFASAGVLLISIILAFRYPDLAPLFALGALSGIAGPWLHVLRNSDFGAPRDERTTNVPPLWPLLVCLVTLPLFGIGAALLVGYGLAMIIVALTRDRKPSSMPLPMMVLGIFFAPVGQVLSSLQTRGRPIAWPVGFGTVGAVLGIILIHWGLDSDRVFPFSLGISLLLFWIALTLQYFRVRERVSFTVVSFLMLLYWYIPSSVYDGVTGELRGDFEMFFLSGVAMITAGTFIVVYNADILLPAIGALGSRFGRIFPAVKTAVAYPLTSRFRTGMTVAMIGLIMFSLVMFQTINTNFARVFLGDEARGGFDAQAVVNPNNPIEDFPAAVEAGGGDASQITAAAEARFAYPFETQVRYPEPVENDDGVLVEYAPFTIAGADEVFTETNTIGLTRAAGYEDDRSAWQALDGDPSLAVVSTTIFGIQGDFGGGFGPDLVDLGDEPDAGFEPIPMTVRNPSTGEERTFMIIGVMEDRADTFFQAAWIQSGAFAELFPAARAQTFYFNVAEGADPEDVADDVEAALLTASVDSLGALLDDFSRQQRGFLYLFQGFMGLGLLVGIAALGVIASRAVVERRQQIGMLRAIGYQRRMVALSFLFESGFVALSGILMGLVLAVSLTWVLFVSGDIGEGTEDAGFVVPWIPLAVICGIAFGASMLMTFLPARGAAQVPVAEALRFE